MALGEKENTPAPNALGFLFVVYLILFIGYLGLRHGLFWYGGLLHPNAAAPAWAFGPTWVAICLILGYAGWTLWTAQRSRARRMALGLFFVQLIGHSVWVWLLFGFQKPLASLVALGFLGVVAIASFFAGHRVRPVTAVLVIPFLLWLFYAGFLNFSLWSLNYKNGVGVGHIETIVGPS